MNEWIAQHSDVLNVLLNAGVLLVWLLYAQLLLSSYLRHRRCRILITQGMGTSVTSHCMISNMSEQGVFIQCVVVRVKSSHGTREFPVTDFDLTQSGEIPDTPRQGTGQGPLLPSQYLDMGSFAAVIRRAEALPARMLPWVRRRLREEPEEFRILEINVIASYGPEGGFVGARRNFQLCDGGRGIRPATTDTAQLRSFRARRRMRRWLRQFI